MSDKRRPKGTGSIRERDGGHQTRISFTDPHTGTRRQRSKRFDTRTDARKWINTELARIEEGIVAMPGRSPWAST